MEIIRLETTESTNFWLAERADSLEAPCLVYALRQTAGRGQRGNSWEAEPGMNLTASALLRPEGIEAASQFSVSEAVALAVADVLGMHGIEARVKWPNDIYVGDRKICGILIENSIYGRTIGRSVAGIGINVNQTRFVGDAPNPVSMAMLNGETYSLEDMAGNLAAALESRLAMLGDRERLHEEFMERLWRGDGIAYPFADRRAGERIKASIEAVDPDGMLTLCLDGGETLRYAFKEVEFLLDGADSILK